MTQFAYLPSPKPSHKRNKPRARTRGAISPKVRQQLKERSQGVCERCSKAEAVHAAHLERRWKLERTTVQDLAHLCVPCHINADQTAEGRVWLQQFHERLMNHASTR